MSRIKYRIGLIASLIFLCLLGLPVWRVQADGFAQVPTGSLPTVTGTSVLAMALVLDNDQGQATVRSGPNTVGYAAIGILTPGQQVPVLGVSPGGEWYQIAYPGAPDGVGWVWSVLVRVDRTNLPTVIPPPSATPRITTTINPTLAARFLVEAPPTRPPTFTPPAPVSAPTFPPDTGRAAAGRVPVGFIIVGMAVVGLFGTLISFLRGR